MLIGWMCLLITRALLGEYLPTTYLIVFTLCFVCNLLRSVSLFGAITENIVHHTNTNKSGKNRGAAYDDFPESGWDKLMALNVKAIFYTTVGLEPLLLKNATSDSPTRVINIASMAAINTGDVTTTESGGLSAVGHGTYSYGPSKAACVHLSRLQASKLAPKHINVNVVCPGVFPSRMTAFGLREAMDTLTAGQPGGRIGKPSDFAGLILFLSGLGGAHMVGGVFEIDGGSTRTGYRRIARDRKL